MAMITCRECGNSVSSAAKSCPHCGIAFPALRPRKAQRGSLKVLGSILAVMVIGIIAAINSGDGGGASRPPASDQPAEAQAKTALPVAAAAPPPNPMPADEQQFIDAVQNAAAAFDAGANDMAKGATRPARARQVCAAVPSGGARNWLGTIETLSSNSDGKGVLVLRIDPHITIGTTNNDFSDSMSELHTLIPPGSPVFTTASSLSVGAKVMFSGAFGRSETDCLEEMSVTQAGSMQDPEYLMAFSALAPAP